ncbi:hypothetical protein QEK82_001243 [Stenotrophomonas maltophilia]|uniref:hypothetical protein n=1 Tax=Stenotrophomonas maltophilia group sp. Smal13 TaxID=3377166 RepID=UPI0013121ABF|nr:hypothetical protein [Stenotrophomonas maltophilia]EKU9957548.1 hypothetical protein [Stenotrophomonas maltophilia]EKU9984455.1 hypothetical protein [Stenotrophomonas maltophilia]
MPRFVKELRRTLLIVGEGDAEELLLGKLKAALTAGKQGPSVTVRNAKGKGALNVINETIRHARQGSYNVKAAVFDTDACWDGAVAARARRAGVVTVTHDPCLESVLLASAGYAMEGSSAELKRRFLQQFGYEAHEAIARGTYDINRLRQANPQLPCVVTLLGLFA